MIGGRDDYARQWLEDRLTSTVDRLLAGICNRAAKVKFIDIEEITAQRALSSNFIQFQLDMSRGEELEFIER